MFQNVIAIICDCDGTLCPDTTNLLVNRLGLDSDKFWSRDVAELVENGWDPPLAYLTMLLEQRHKPGAETVTVSKLKTIGEAIDFYPGALDFVDRMRRGPLSALEYRDSDISLEWYIVSSGIEDLLKATPLSSLANDVFGCALEFDGGGQATAVKRAVTFTEKTKFIYAINKGISGQELRRRPYRVNDAMEQADRRVPFEHMVYIGDGPSDIPCFSMIKQLKGHAIGVMPPEDTELRRPYELAQGDHLTVGPYTANYREGSDLFKMLSRIVTGVADSILEKRESKVRLAPRH